jgi:hypothetical protein
MEITQREGGGELNDSFPLLDAFFATKFPPLTLTTAHQRKNLYYKSFAEHRKHNIYYPYEWAVACYPLFLIIIGTIFNMTSFLIMQRQALKKYSCFRILSILALTDASVLYQWNLNTFFKYHLSKPPAYHDLEEIHLFWCRWISFFAFSTLQLSSWLLSLVSVDRVMIIYSHYWKTKVSARPMRVNLLIASCLIVIFSMNSHILFWNGYTVKVAVVDPVTNLTTAYVTNVVCYKARNDDKYIFPNWNKGWYFFIF